MDNQNQPNLQNLPTVPPQNINPGLESEKPLTQTDKVKRAFFQILIGCLLCAAGIAVIAVLVGSFNNTLARALGTIGAVAVHALLGFSYITETEKRDKKSGTASTEFFSNTVFTLIAISFITSIFAIWQLLSSNLTLKLYILYGIILFATLHADVLYRIRGFDTKIDRTVAANYVFMSVVIVLLTIVDFASDPSTIGQFFYRILAAVGIIDATMTITVAIMHKMYLQKHPVLTAAEAQAPTSKSKNFWKNPFVIILFIFLGFQVIGSLVALFMSGF